MLRTIGQALSSVLKYGSKQIGLSYPETHMLTGEEGNGKKAQHQSLLSVEEYHKCQGG